MKVWIKKTLVILLAVFIIIQFFRPGKNRSGKTEMNEIAVKYSIPDTVKNILKTSCYDCHSNNTVYPWYAEVQPVAMWLGNHIDEGKDELNFSEFGTYNI